MNTPNRAIVATAFSISLIACQTPSTAFDDDGVMRDLTEITWEQLKSNPKWMIAKLHGDREKSMPFTIRLKIPANEKVPPHWHPIVEHFNFVSGTFHLAPGECFDESRLRPLPAGSFATMPAKHWHFAQTREETIVQIHGVGPWNINRVKCDGKPPACP